MQIAAQTVMEQYDGKLPADYEKLLELKGIGHYTAGAIASIAYGIPVPAFSGDTIIPHSEFRIPNLKYYAFLSTTAE